MPNLIEGGSNWDCIDMTLDVSVTIEIGNESNLLTISQLWNSSLDYSSVVF